MKAAIFGIVISLSVAAPTSHTQAQQLSIPYLSGPVLDEAGVLDNSSRIELSELIRSLSNRIQFQIWTVPSLQGESVEGLSLRAVEIWKLGTEKQDNGVLILLALKERQIRIEVGQGLEGDVPDVMAARVIDHIMVPKLRTGKTAEAFRLAIEAINQMAAGQQVPGLAPRDKKSNGMLTLLWLVLIFGFAGYGMFMRLKHPHLVRGRHRGGWHSSGRTWGGGFGGGWSGGGGGFSGGGATGRW